MIFRRLDEVASFIRGVTFKPDDVVPDNTPNTIWCMRTKNVQANLDLSDTWSIGTTHVKRSEQYLQQGDLLVSSANSWNLVGKCCWVPKLSRTSTFGGFISALRANKSELEPRYLYWWFSSPTIQARIRSFGRQTTNIANLDIARCLKMLIPVPPLQEQRRIAEVLDHADELRTMRRQAITLLDDLSQSIFLDMFGDPRAAMVRWRKEALGELSTVFSDGPFGSNLKSSHYRNSGVRVIRLQNIGVGKFIDNDAAFISEEHFSKLSKHACRPGDVIIGTLGEPNIRAFVQPATLELALNKADCVQMRVDPNKATANYIAALLNQPGTEKMARSLMRGQTRIRISMGKLRTLEVPVPPLPLQMEFGRRIASLEDLRTQQQNDLATLDELFSSLQRKAFQGEL